MGRRKQASRNATPRTPWQEGKSTSKTQRWNGVPDTNEAFVKFYKAQGIIAGSDDDHCDEWLQFMATLRSDLPTTFRVTGSKSSSHDLNDTIKDTFIPFLSGLSYQDAAQQPLTPLQWYPGGLAWSLKVPKHVIRKVPQFKKFQNFLVYESEAGNISRQEAVSMIPPLLLDVEPSHIVLDTCAAPGSKTAQLLEALHTAPAASNNASATFFIPEGLLIANDSDYKRAQLLVHQSLRRIPSPSMMVTNLDATLYPNFKRSTTNAKGLLKFDRILCDVPCSGDGTMRKNLAIWKDWTMNNALGLHPVQLRILTRAIAMLKPGGRIVYSTCSMSPIENESVISAVLESHSDVRLVDVSDRLPGLIRRPGLTSWKVMKRDLSATLDTYSDACALTDEKDRKFQASMWPNGKEVERHLDYCVRIYPHLQDTGGFFIAVLQKDSSPDVAITTGVEAIATSDEHLHKRLKQDSSHLPSSSSPLISSTELPKVVATDQQSTEVDKIDRPFKEDPYTFLSPDDEQVEQCWYVLTDLSSGGLLTPSIGSTFFGLDDNFPRSNLFVRNASGQPLRSIYLTSSIVRELVEGNNYNKMRLVSCGVKLFARQDKTRMNDDMYQCKWRIVSDGTTFFKPYIGQTRLLKCTLETLHQLLDGKEPYPQFDVIKEDRFRQRVIDMKAGSCIAEVEVGEFEGAVLKRPLSIGVWVSKTSVNVMVDKQDRTALSLRLWGRDISQVKASKSTGEGKGKEVEADVVDDQVESEALTNVGVDGEAKADLMDTANL